MVRWILLFLIVPALCSCALAENADSEPSPLWPEIEPFQSGFLKVSDLHELYFEVCGNPDGKPVFALHGGPGGRCSPYMRRFYDPEKFLIVLHDQRGAGRSKPFAETKDNNTQALVEDIERLRKHLGIEKTIILFGGSWGSTLGLAYAETYPEQVAGLVLRGVFTSTQAEIDHFYHGGVRKFFPGVYDRFVNALPDPERRPIPAYLNELLHSDDKAVCAKYADIWARYEIRIAALDYPDDKVDEVMKTFDPLAFARMENYYMAHKCFLEEDQLIRNAGRLSDIPVVIVNGRYDVVCPPVTAYRLHKQLPKSKLIVAEGSGHWMGEPAIEKALIKAIRSFE